MGALSEEAVEILTKQLTFTHRPHAVLVYNTTGSLAYIYALSLLTVSWLANQGSRAIYPLLVSEGLNWEVCDYIVQLDLCEPGALPVGKPVCDTGSI